MEKILEYLDPKAFNKVHYVAMVFWILISVIFLAIFVDMENNESRFDFRCGGAKSENVDIVRGKCYEKYMKQYNKFGFPIFGFVILNLVLIAFVCAIYSKIGSAKVDQLSRGIRDQETASSTGNRLFFAYCCQLSIRIVLGLIFIILQTHLLYPLKFYSKFNCYLTDGTTQPRNLSDNAQNSTLHACHNQRAEKKTFWMYAVLVMNGIHVAGILVETVYLISRACIERGFMQDSKFLKTHLRLNQHQKRKFKKFIKRTLKEAIVEETQEPFGLQSFLTGNPGENTMLQHWTLDQIYTNLVAIPDRVTYQFTENREEQLKIYPMSRGKNSQPKSLEDLLNVKKNKKVLIVGRAGIGKTLFCTKLLRDWASPEAKIPFDAAFFVKFRKFKSEDNLSLRELLINSEYFPTNNLDDEVWNHLIENPKGVLILFDGFDEFKLDANMDQEPPRPRYIEEKKPLQILYQWLVTGKLLKDASIVTTTRPTALSSIKHLNKTFANKTFEILGFSSEQVKEYVYKLAGDEKSETLWRHISSNMNLLSLCYVPVNSFIICTTLLQIMESESSDDVTLPAKLTSIYKIAVQVFYFKHTRELCHNPFTVGHNLPTKVLKQFNELGRVAFEGIKKGELILEGSEVSGMEDSPLFHRLPDRKTDSLNRESQFCFIHLTMQEFFAARHLANNMSDTELKSFVSENIKNGKWQLVFQFLAGLMEDKIHLSNEIITNLLPVETEESYTEQWTHKEEKWTVTCWPTSGEKDLAMTLIKCLNENCRMKLEAQEKIQQLNINFVNFNSCRLTAVDCSSLVNVINVPQISHLNLSFNNIDSLGCFEICKLLKYRESQLSWLDLTRNQFTEEAVKHLAEAINNNNCQLRTLILPYNNISDIGAQHLAEAINNNNCQLHTLDLTQNNISHIGAQHLADAINNNNCQLHTLNLTNNEISDIGAQHLAEAINNNNCQLHTLDLIQNNISHIGAQHLADAINNNNCQLRTLNLRTNNISDIGAQHLAEAINNNNCQLHTLDLTQNNISHIGAQHLAEAINNNNCQLHTLNLTHNNISHIGAQHLAEAINNNNCQLHTLDLTKNNISDIGAQHLADAINNNNCQLRTLNLRANNISDIGAQHLAEAINNNNCQLHTLDLTRNNISHIGAQHLADAINNNNCQLHTLNLTNNEISDIGAQHLAEAINNNNCQLQTLILTNNEISDIGAQHLAEAINNNNCQLHTLDLTDNNISDIGAQHLAEAINNNNCQLHTLDLTDNNISDIGAQHLAEAINNNNCQQRTLYLLQNRHITEKVKQHALNLLRNNQSKCKLYF
ncbi:protein NLRC3-like [Pocillopora verrucosa]|uniref:protein NLRC3-like n=1 Tax=Pocillopora verrucosa TaxID=203993 RepID=UPI00333E3A6F